MSDADPARALRDLTPKHSFFVGIDSDGCAFDTMEIKHKECFIPNIIAYWDLQPVSKYAREAAEFVNLYSKWRGINRWPALTMVFDLLMERPEVRKRQVNDPSGRPGARVHQVGPAPGQPGAQGPGGPDGRPRAEAGAGLERGGQRQHRVDGPRRAALPLRAREPGTAAEAKPT